ncbi:two pore domain potassium channel family protein [Moritella sp. 5]|uniref:potassium channel family protein n=1 Tax=Moritella sp. 5 TaxID=2746231 RepID=UPI001BAAA047|nr:potassium channel family protein [Moritella sp. 5]QUM81161.1 two pore domain potassium channel family protein [Moritella sp. 5]
MKFDKSNPWVWLVFYVIIILFFALGYSLFPLSSFNKTISGYDYIYFSVVTITTLGYGDIYPTSSLAKFIVNVESILGILLIGLFLNSLWHRFTIEMGQKQKAREEGFEKERNNQKLLSIWDYTYSILEEYLTIIDETTNSERQFTSLKKISESYKFSSLISLFEPSYSLLRGDFKKEKFKWFYEIEIELTKELRELTQNPIFIDEKLVYTHLIELLGLIKTTDISNFLYAFEKSNVGEERLFDMLKSMISEHEFTPDINKYKSNIITPIIVFDKGLREKILLIEKLVMEIEELKNKD